jgi:hypothetical protein
MELMDRETISKAIDWIHSVQRPDGSWYGSWYVPSLLFFSCSFISRRKPRRLKLGEPRKKRRRKKLTIRGICFTYATMFALESLAIAGETHENSAAVRRACDFLVSKQMEDGGWGETYMVSIPASTFFPHIHPPSSTLPPTCTHHHTLPRTMARILAIARILTVARPLLTR